MALSIRYIPEGIWFANWILQFSCHTTIIGNHIHCTPFTEQVHCFLNCIDGQLLWSNFIIMLMGNMSSYWNPLKCQRFYTLFFTQHNRQGQDNIFNIAREGHQIQTSQRQVQLTKISGVVQQAQINKARKANQGAKDQGHNLCFSVLICYRREGKLRVKGDTDQPTNRANIVQSAFWRLENRGQRFAILIIRFSSRLSSL